MMMYQNFYHWVTAAAEWTNADRLSEKIANDEKKKRKQLKQKQEKNT